MTLAAPSNVAFPRSVARLREALAPGRGSALLLPSLSALDWVMTLPNAAAPGFVYLGAACRGVPVGGGGRDLAEAGARLAGEAAEVLAQLAPPALFEGPSDPAIDRDWTGGARAARVAAVNLTRGRRVAVPAAAIHIRPALDADLGAEAPPRSLGLGAGPDRAAARLSGLLELIERDAAFAWWIEGRRPRAFDAVPTAPAATDLARLRAGAVPPGRPTTFLDLVSPTGVAVVCALSRDPGGGGLAFGLKAGLCPRLAAQGAAIELLQMEMALELARHRLAQGRVAESDAGPLDRAALDPDAWDAFSPLPPAGCGRPSIAGFDDLVAHLAAQGQEVTVADLAGPAGAPLHVAKVFVPGLRPMPSGAARAVPGAPGTEAELM